MAHLTQTPLVVLGVVLVIGVILIRVMQLNVRTFLPSILLPNIGNMGLPLCLFAFGENGLTLAQLRIAELRHSLLFSVIRVVGGCLVALLVASWFGLEGIERGVLVLQFSMPVAIFNYLLAVRFDREPGEVAGMVVMSTLLSFVFLPFVVAFVLV